MKMRMKMGVRLTPEEKSAVPDWAERVGVFIYKCDERFEDKQERFRLCLHEASHAIQFRQFGWNVKFSGPHVEYEAGKLRFYLGEVSPVRLNNYEPLPWQHAMVFIAGFKWVEHFTGLPDANIAIQRDLASLRAKLGEVADVEEAVWQAEMMLEDQLSQPGFVDDLRRMVRGYELIVFNTVEATTWGWKHFRLDLPGQRYAVGHDDLNWLLVDDGKQLRLIVDGAEVSPAEEYELFFVAGGASASKRAADAVNRWNKMVRATATSRVFKERPRTKL